MRSIIVFTAMFLYVGANNASNVMVYDRVLAIELAAAYLEAFRKTDQEPSLIPEDFFYPIVGESWGKDGGEYVFIGFKNQSEKSGGIAIFEVCSSLVDLRLVALSSSPNVSRDASEFTRQSAKPYESICKKK